MMRRQYGAWRRFELTGQVTPIHRPALADLVGRASGIGRGCYFRGAKAF